MGRRSRDIGVACMEITAGMGMGVGLVYGSGLLVPVLSAPPEPYPFLPSEWRMLEVLTVVILVKSCLARPSVSVGLS